MAAFEYKALDGKGKQKKGLLEADTPRQVRQRLKEQGLFPVEVIETKAKQNKQAKSAFSYQRKISTAELSLLTRQLATLVQAAMPLEECLRAVAEQSESARIGNMLMGVRAKVVEGYTLADSLREYPQVFDDLFCSMVAAGEKSGHLDAVLERLADYAEKRQQLKSKLQQAMIYPVMLIVIAVSVVAFLLATVVPKIVAQFVQMGQELPTPTQVLLILSDFVLDYGVAICVALVLLVIVSKLLLKRPAIRLKWDQKVLNLPVIGKVARGLNTSRFARTLSICTSSAIPLLEGMMVAADVMGNQFFKQQVLEAADKVREGGSLRRSLEQTKLFPPMMLHMIASGEQSGELEQMLTRSADNQDRDFESQVNIALGVFQPLLVVAMAGVVLFIVVATILPLMEMNNLVSG
ncbi:general secretion pathway protein GspF [Vibrio sp. qd031]|uniref:type II secretion system inner membrane protein GspF n=1 Tax=Vibrio sp. qd031 TaxID=1603038 RepID=UPI000A0F528D|nr:type II secretion system inner membrane protein GspF [Vibrio sp. qd031]ORT51668.1 general secretion pathway protein GspF [Vibrio sp. qd031]